MVVSPTEVSGRKETRSAILIDDLACRFLLIVKLPRPNQGAGTLCYKWLFDNVQRSDFPNLLGIVGCTRTTGTKSSPNPRKKTKPQTPNLPKIMPLTCWHLEFDFLPTRAKPPQALQHWNFGCVGDVWWSGLDIHLRYQSVRWAVAPYQANLSTIKHNQGRKNLKLHQE